MSKYYVCCSTDGKERRISTTFDDIYYAFIYVADHYRMCYAPHMTIDSDSDISYSIIEDDQIVVSFKLMRCAYSQQLVGEYDDFDVYIGYAYGAKQDYKRFDTVVFIGKNKYPTNYKFDGWEQSHLLKI